MSTLGPIPIHRVDLAVPRYGAWRADVVLSSGEPPAAGPATLTVGGLEMRGAVLRSGLDAPGRPRATVVGGAGWERVLAKPLSYQSDAGVRLSTVLRDLAAFAEEPIEQPAEVRLGVYFASAAGQRGRDVLAVLHRIGRVAPWRVDPDGVTRFGARVGAEVTARATELRRDAGLGVVTLGIDEPASFLPGALLEGVAIERLLVRETAGKLEADVWLAVGGATS